DVFNFDILQFHPIHSNSISKGCCSHESSVWVCATSWRRASFKTCHTHPVYWLYTSYSAVLITQITFVPRMSLALSFSLFLVMEQHSYSSCLGLFPIAVVMPVCDRNT